MSGNFFKGQLHFLIKKEQSCIIWQEEGDFSMAWSWGIVETRDRHMRLGKSWLGSWWALPFYDNSVFPEGGLGHPLILAVAGMCVACRDLGCIIPNAENTPKAREVHKQKSRPFLQSWYILILKFLPLSYTGRLCFCRVGEAKQDRAKRRQTPASILSPPPPSWLCRLCLFTGVAILW